jgi:hypothetical protein
VKKVFGILTVLLVGLTVLSGYFFQAQLSPVLALIFQTGLVLFSAAGLIGIGYLLVLHIRRVIRGEKRIIQSVVLLIAFLIALIVGFVLTPQSTLYRDLILNVQIPVEASLLAVLAVTLLYASLRLIRVRGWTPMSIAFLGSAVFSLVLNSGLIQVSETSLGGRILAFLERLPLVGARGILIGMALGGLVMGLRYLLSLDRPYGGE